MSAELNLHLHPRQNDALTSGATEILYGGAAGGGKSHLMRVAAVIWCATIPGLQVYLFRRIESDLIKNHIEGPKGLRAMLAPWVLSGWVQITATEIRFWNGSKIFLCHCKDEKHRFKYLGAEIHVLLIDELTTFTDVIYRFLRGRVRAVGLPALPPEYQGRFPRILCSSNPGNVGHGWVKAAFVDRGEWGIAEMPDSEGGMLRQFIPAKLKDNPSMEKDDPNYRLRLRGLGSAALVKAMEDGDWNVIEGAYFDTWSHRNVIDEPFIIPAWWMKFRSFDWGSAKPFSVGFWAVSDGEDVNLGGDIRSPITYPRGALIRYQEWYGCKQDESGASIPDTGLKMTAEEVGAGILSRSRRGHEFTYNVADPAIFAVDGGPSIAERTGIVWRKADNRRVPQAGAMGGWDQMRQRIQGEDSVPMLYVFKTCRDFVRTVPILQHDPDKPEDLDTDAEDHVADETRYACMSRPWTKTRPGKGRPTLDPMRGTDLGVPMRPAPERRERI